VPSIVDDDTHEDADREQLTTLLTVVATVVSLPLALCYLAFGAAGLAAGTLVGLSLLVLFWSAVGGC
jgi:predicted permease